MIATLRGKAGTVGVILSVTEQLGLFLSSHVVFAFCYNGGVVIFCVSRTFSGRVKNGNGGRRGVYEVSVW